MELLASLVVRCELSAVRCLMYLAKRPTAPLTQLKYWVSRTSGHRTK